MVQRFNFVFLHDSFLLIVWPPAIAVMFLTFIFIFYIFLTKNIK